MKKMYLLLLVLCQVWTFTACSDDDKEDVKKPQMPITNLSVAAEAFIGEDLNILGTGFTETTELYLKNTKEVKTKLVIKERTASGLVVTIPATLEAGTYKLVLKQGDEWELQDIKLLPAIPLKNLKMRDYVGRGAVLTITGEGFVKTCEMYLESEAGQDTPLEILQFIEKEGKIEGVDVQIPDDIKTGTYAVWYKLSEVDKWSMGNIDIMTDQRLKKVVIQDILNSRTTTYVYGYDEENRMTTVSQRIKESRSDTTYQFTFTYSGTALTLARDEKEIASYKLTDGRVSHATYVYQGSTLDQDWEYTTDGYLESVPSLENSFVIENGNINYNDEYIYDEEQCLSNHFKYDVFVYLFTTAYRNDVHDQLLLPILTGLTGKRTTLLPCADCYDDLEYMTKGEYVTMVKGVTPDETKKLEFSYEFFYE